MRRQLDTFVGRAVVKLDRPRKTLEHEWYLELDGGIRIVNKDELRTDPPIIPNINKFLFTTVILSESATEVILHQLDKEGKITSAEWRVAFTPGKFHIYDRVKKKSWNPADPIVIETPPHPDERVAEGPDEGWESPDADES